MRLFKTRKGKIFFVVLLAIMFLAVILPLAFNISYNKEKKFNKYLGESQLMLLKTYEKGEKAVYYIEQAGKLAFRQALHDIAESGGVTGECGSFSGYNLWNSENKECYPEDLVPSIEKSLLLHLAGYFQIFPAEKIPEIRYEFITGESQDRILIAGKAKNSLRMDVSEEGAYNFKADEIEQFPGGPIEEIPPDCMPSCDGRTCGSDGCGGNCGTCQAGKICSNGICVISSGIPAPSGKCGYVIEYAHRYAQARCPYSLDAAPIATPETCHIRGLTCATFVTSVTAIVLKEATHGNGNTQCNSASVTKIGVDPNLLQPGDIFSSEVYYNGKYTPWGHTGMYVGRGYISDRGEGGYCWRTFTPDPNGHQVFIHSIGNRNLGKPGVCYDTYDHLFKNSIFILTSFCRPNKCW